MSLEINNEVIDDDLIEEELGISLRYRGTVTPEERGILLQEVKENLIYKTLLRQEAEKSDIKIPLEHIDREYRLFFSQQTIPGDIAAVKKHIENKLKESILIDQICGDLIPPQEAHLRTFFEDNREHYLIAKEFHYWEYGFRYEKRESYSLFYDFLSRLKEDLTRLPHTKKTIPSKILGWDEVSKYFFSKEWKTPIGKLTQEGLNFLNQLEEIKVSRIIDHSGESLIFTPVKLEELSQNQPLVYLGFFFHINSRQDFIPDFEEISSQVAGDLWEEMRQIKVRAYLRQVMEKSSIRDISYL